MSGAFAPTPPRALRAAFLCSADSYRGSAVSLEHIAHGLAARGGAVRVFTGASVVTEPLRAAGVDVVQLDVASTNWKTARQLRRQLGAFDADVLVVDRPRDLRLGLLATIRSRVGLVNRYNTHAARPPSDILTRLAYLAGVRQTIFLTREMAERILRLAPWMRRAPHRVIAEGVDLEAFAADPAAASAFRAAHGLAADEPFLLVVGALTREKRGDFLLDAVRLVHGAPTLVVCGEGPMDASLRAQATRLGVSARFLGRVDRGALRGAYSAATLLVHACRVETFGLSVLEAMACGCPVVGMRAGGLLEVVGDDGAAGVLVNPDDPAAMASAIRHLLTDQEQAARVGSAARDRARRLFSLDRMAAGYEDALRAALALHA